MKNTNSYLSTNRIRLHIKEALSYSWALSEKRNKGVRIIRAIGDFLAHILCDVKISSREIESLILSNPEKYFNCYFAKSLRDRGISICEYSRLNLIDKAKAKEKLSVNLEKYSGSFKVLVCGVEEYKKTKIINKLMNNSNNDDLLPRISSKIRRKEDIDFHKLSDSVVLCDLPSHLRSESFSTLKELCEKFDAVVILGINDVCEDVENYINVAKKANKPYLLAIDRDIHLQTEVSSNNIENDDIEKDRQKVSEKLANDLMPSNGKPFFVDAYSDKYDDKELEQLIKNKLVGTSLED